MDTWIWIVIAAVVVVAVILIAAAVFARRRRRSHLKERFGPEYDRTVDSADRRRQAERELHEREQRHDQLELRPLAPAARERYEQRWATLQSDFVDRPQVAVADADSLIVVVMRDRGYPVEDFDSNRDLLSVEHGRVVDDYRKGHELYLRTVEGTASTEDLRQAVVAYRSLFEELVRDDDGRPQDVGTDQVGATDVGPAEDRGRRRSRASDGRLPSARVGGGGVHELLVALRHLDRRAEVQEAAAERERDEREPGPAEDQPADHVAEPVQPEQHS